MHRITLSILALSLSFSLHAQSPSEAQALHDKGLQGCQVLGNFYLVGCYVIFLGNTSDRNRIR